ncbi:hypothetical protein C0992_010771 [Termitomyces sp. T32_za158]|nr:hypothetical protein C0992_010771 [Termitomyces sp. T32_za158]
MANERKEHEKKMNAARDKGVAIEKKRKEHSDKGKQRTRGKLQLSNKRRKTTSQLPPTYKSAEFIDDNEDEPDESDKEQDGSDNGHD